MSRAEGKTFFRRVGLEDEVRLHHTANLRRGNPFLSYTSRSHDSRTRSLLSSQLPIQSYFSRMFSNSLKRIKWWKREMERNRNSFQAFPRWSTLASGWGMWVTSSTVLIVSLIWHMECYGGASSEMTQVLAHVLSSDHLAKPNSLPLNRSLKVLSTNSPPYQLHLREGCIMCVPGRQTGSVVLSEQACLPRSVCACHRHSANWMSLIHRRYTKCIT